MNAPPKDGFRYASPAEAVAAVVACLRAVGTESVPVEQSLGRVLAERLCADRDSPAMDVSAMDGFAVRLEDLASGPLPIAGEVRIGKPPPTLVPGSALRIVTGAPVPQGADVVIRHEDASERDGKLLLAVAPGVVARGASIRRQGENSRAGAAVVEPGVLISPATIGTLAAFGRATVVVHRPVRVAIVVTGDELVLRDAAQHAHPEPWQLRDSNGPAAAGLLGARRWLSVVSQRHALDSPGALREAIAAGIAGADAVLLTGGVSMGHRDFVPSVVAELGGRTVFHKLPQRPGKPMLAAIVGEAGAGAPVPVLGLPGNPVSVLVTARRLAVPILARLAGLDLPDPVPTRAVLRTDDSAVLNLWWHRLVRRNDDGGVSPVGGKGSGDVAAAAGSDGFVELPPGSSGPGPWPFYTWFE